MNGIDVRMINVNNYIYYNLNFIPFLLFSFIPTNKLICDQRTHHSTIVPIMKLHSYWLIPVYMTLVM